MTHRFTARLKLGLRLASLIAGLAGPAAAEERRPALDPNIITYTLPADIKWESGQEPGAFRASLYGDGSKPGGAYAGLVKFLPGSMTKPHIHPTDRHIFVVSGVWWAGAGTEFAPDKTVPMGPGTYVRQLAGQPHFDGAKDVETILIVSGVGPAGSRPATAPR